MLKYNINQLFNKDMITVELFGKQKQIQVFSRGDNRIGKGTIFELSKEELDILNWFLNNINIENYKLQILDYCNYNYREYSDKQITIDDIENEINIFAIAITIKERMKLDNTFPDISFYGDCKSDEEHGVCIGFKNKKFIGIGQQNWIL